MALPVYALVQLARFVDWRLLAGVPAAFSAVAFFAYRNDKHRAEAGDWRIPESTLHLTEFLGGWPGAFLAQRQFRHKTSKISFQVVFWAIVITHQCLAADSLMGWRFTKETLRFLESRLG